MTKRDHSALKARANAQLAAARLVNHYLAKNDWANVKTWVNVGAELQDLDMTPNTEDSSVYQSEESSKIVLSKEQSLLADFEHFVGLATKRIAKECGPKVSYDALLAIANR